MDRKNLRNYGLDRISKLNISPDKFSIPSYDIEEHYKNVFEIETYEPETQIILEVNSQ